MSLAATKHRPWVTRTDACLTVALAENKTRTTAHRKTYTALYMVQDTGLYKSHRMYLERSFFFSRSPRASAMCCSVTVYVSFSPRSVASLACHIPDQL